MPHTDRPDDVAVQALDARIRGGLLRPGDEGYDGARAAWNGRFDRRPALVARCSGAADVMAAVRFAGEHDLLISVKSGGHDYAGNSVSDGGLLIDLSAMRAVRVDPRARKVWAQPGARWGAVDHETQAHGLATTGGTVSTVGVAGYVLGGGTGYLARKHGLAVDNLVAADLVTARGELVRASEEENPDLFWAIRGGGGNFGVVTSFELRLHEVGPEVAVAQAWHPFEAAGDALRFHRAFMADAPDEVQCYPFVLRVPPVDPFPQELHGKPAVVLVGCHAGAPEVGEAALAPLRDFGEPFLSFVQTMPYTAVQQSFDAGMGAGHRWYTKAHYLDAFTDDAIDVFVRHAARLPGPFSMAYVEPGGGAIGRVDPAATAFPHRGAACGVHIWPGWTDAHDDDAMLDWARAFHEALAPHATGGAYVNLLAGDEEDPPSVAWAGNRQRLQAIKSRWDPHNRFRMNHNIEPAS